MSVPSPTLLRHVRRLPQVGCHGIHSLRRQWGTVLLEVMLAMLLGTVVLLAACHLLMTTAISSGVVRQNNLAYNAARAIVENIRLYHGATLANGTYQDVRLFGPVPQLAELPGSTASAVIGTYRTAPTSTVKIVTVTVSWSSPRTDGGTRLLRTRKITALVAPRGVTP